MPMYCYSRDNHVVERFYHMGDAPDKIRVNNMTYHRDLAAEHIGVPPEGNWPIECIGSGVHADQAQELRDYYKEHGLNIEVSKNGNPIYKSAKEQREGLKCRHMINKSSFY